MGENASILLDEKTTDEELIKEIQKSRAVINNQIEVTWLADSAPFKVSKFGGGGIEQISFISFKVLIEQNKILIHQNELNRRLLEKLLKD